MGVLDGVVIVEEERAVWGELGASLCNHWGLFDAAVPKLLCAGLVQVLSQGTLTRWGVVGRSTVRAEPCVSTADVPVPRRTWPSPPTPSVPCEEVCVTPLGLCVSRMVLRHLLCGLIKSLQAYQFIYQLYHLVVAPPTNQSQHTVLYTPCTVAARSKYQVKCHFQPPRCYVIPGEMSLS